MPDLETGPERPERRTIPSPWNRVLGLLLLVTVLQWLGPPYLYSPNTLTNRVTADENVHVAEARAWLRGRLDLLERPYDAAEFEGRYFNVFPPLFSIIAAAVLPFSPEGIPRWIVLLLVWAPVPLLGYAVFLRCTGAVLPAVVLSTAFILGTSYAVVLERAVTTAPVWQTNHALSQIGLLLFLLDYFGKRRIWSGALGLMIAVWARPLTAVYFLPLAAAAVRLPPGPRTKRLIAGGAVTVISIAVPLTLNALKFGNPLDFGYAHLYQGRDDEPARRAQQGLFSPRFIPDNLRALVAGFPQVRRHEGHIRIRFNEHGTGVWWTTPLLLYLIVRPRDWWRDRPRAELMLAAALTLAGILTYHTTGYAQRGYNRFSLDYICVLLAVVGPSAFGRRRWPITLLLVCWSVVYFRAVG